MPKLGYKVPDMGTPAAISNTLFTRTQARVLSILFAQPERRYYLNEILAMANGGSGAIRRELGRLLAAGLVEKSSEGNRQYYQANSASPLFKELQALIARLSKLEKPPVDPRLVPGMSTLCRRHGVKRLALFGSAARGDMNADSDLDLLVEFMPNEAPTLASLTQLKDELEKLFAHRVDLATPAILNNPHRRKAIEKDMEVIYERKGSRVPVGHARRRD